nr:MAG: putative maturation protein [Leviviridae sp.]
MTDGGYSKSLSVLPDDYVPDFLPYLERSWDVADGDRKTTNPLDIYKDLRYVGFVDGKTSNYWIAHQRAETRNYTLTGRTIPGMPSDAVAVTQALARANPNRPEVSIWQFLGELRDAPKMIFQIGDILRRVALAQRKKKAFVPTARDVASGYLGWTFGWDPLIKDLGKLFDFSEAVDNRIKELNALRSGDLRRTITVFDTRFDEDWDIGYMSPLYQSNARGVLRSTIAAKKWVRIRYKPTALTLSQLGGDLRDRARSLVFGHQGHIVDVWNLIPWTWLLDWFSTTGDFLEANRNHLGVQVDDIAVMTLITARPKSFAWTANPFNASFSVATDHEASWKRRVKGSGPSVSAFVPFLSQKQWSILSALAVTRLM